MDHIARIQNLKELIYSERYLQNRDFDIEYNDQDDSFTIKFQFISKRQLSSLQHTLRELELFHVKIEAMKIVENKKRHRNKK